MEREVWPLIAAGQFSPQVDQIFPLPEAGAAHRLMESSQHIGKTILSVNLRIVRGQPIARSLNADRCSAKYLESQ